APSLHGDVGEPEQIRTWHIWPNGSGLRGRRQRLPSTGRGHRLGSSRADVGRMTVVDLKRENGGTRGSSTVRSTWSRPTCIGCAHAGSGESVGWPCASWHLA